MGMRRNIELKYEDGNKIYLYTHWGAEELREDLKLALIRGKSRWDDPAYLARIIFAEMMHEDISGLAGLGIAPYETDPEFPTIAVDVQDQTVDGLPFSAFIEGNYQNRI
jgi:hypothetical protein